MRILRLLIATASAAVLTVFAVFGMVHVVETLMPQFADAPIAVSERRIDFGNMPINGSERRLLVVRNDSDAPLHARFLVDGSSYRVEPEEVILEPGVEWSVSVVAHPSRPGRMDDILRIHVAGGSNPAVVIPLAGVVDDEPEDPSWKMNRA